MPLYGLVVITAVCRVPPEIISRRVIHPASSSNRGLLVAALNIGQISPGAVRRGHILPPLEAERRVIPDTDFPPFSDIRSIGPALVVAGPIFDSRIRPTASSERVLDPLPAGCLILHF